VPVVGAVRRVIQLAGLLGPIATLISALPASAGSPWEPKWKSFERQDPMSDLREIMLVSTPTLQLGGKRRIEIEFGCSLGVRSSGDPSERFTKSISSGSLRLRPTVYEGHFDINGSGMHQFRLRFDQEAPKPGVVDSNYDNSFDITFVQLRQAQAKNLEQSLDALMGMAIMGIQGAQGSAWTIGQLANANRVLLELQVDGVPVVAKISPRDEPLAGLLRRCAGSSPR
jgi:hypothetical protein